MDPAENVLAVADVALYQGHMVFAVETADEAVGLEIAVFGGQIYRRHPVHQFFVAFAVGLQVPDGDELDVEPLRQF